MERQKELDLTGKVVIVTGASRGVGKCAAAMFARRGAKVVIAARTVDPDPTVPGTVGETLAEIEAFGGEAIAVPTDIGQEADLHTLVDRTVDAFGGVDILINNAALTAGPIWDKGFMELTRQDWLDQFDVNTHAPFTLMQLCVPHMERRGGGRIVNVTTGSGEVFRMVEEPPKLMANGQFSLNHPGYYASKRALDRLTNAVTPELSGKNIYVIGMHPGLVATELVAMRVETLGLDPTLAVPMEVPARMLVYFSACEDPREYAGRLFWAEREMKDMGIEID